MDDLSLPGIDKAVVETLTARMEQLKGEISQAINTMGLRATGATQRSLHVEVTSNEVALWGRKFFASLEYGSRPWTGASGIRCTIADFKAIIDAWASAKGLNFGQHKDHERAISAIAMTIIRKGSRLFRSHAYVDVYDTTDEETPQKPQETAFKPQPISDMAKLKSKALDVVNEFDSLYEQGFIPEDSYRNFHNAYDSCKVDADYQELITRSSKNISDAKKLKEIESAKAMVEVENLF